MYRSYFCWFYGGFKDAAPQPPQDDEIIILQAKFAEIMRHSRYFNFPSL
jgi:hypothetical protein